MSLPSSGSSHSLSRQRAQKTQSAVSNFSLPSSSGNDRPQSQARQSLFSEDLDSSPDPPDRSFDAASYRSGSGSPRKSQTSLNARSVKSYRRNAPPPPVPPYDAQMNLSQLSHASQASHPSLTSRRSSNNPFFVAPTMPASAYTRQESHSAGDLSRQITPPSAVPSVDSWNTAPDDVQQPSDHQGFSTIRQVLRAPPTPPADAVPRHPPAVIPYHMRERPLGAVEQSQLGTATGQVPVYNPQHTPGLDTMSVSSFPNKNSLLQGTTNSSNSSVIQQDSKDTLRNAGSVPNLRAQKSGTSLKHSASIATLGYPATYSSSSPNSVRSFTATTPPTQQLSAPQQSTSRNPFLTTPPVSLPTIPFTDGHLGDINTMMSVSEHEAKRRSQLSGVAYPEKAASAQERVEHDVIVPNELLHPYRKFAPGMRATAYVHDAEKNGEFGGTNVMRLEKNASRSTATAFLVGFVLFPPLYFVISSGGLDNAVGTIPLREKRIALGLGCTFTVAVFVCLIVGLALGV